MPRILPYAPDRRVRVVQNRPRGRFCRTLEHLLGCYSLSRRAPSTTRPPLLAAARVPEPTSAIKSSCCWLLCWWAPAGSAAEDPSSYPWDLAAAALLPPSESPERPGYSANPVRGELSAAAPKPRVDIPDWYGSRGSIC